VRVVVCVVRSQECRLVRARAAAQGVRRPLCQRHVALSRAMTTHAPLRPTCLSHLRTQAMWTFWSRYGTHTRATKHRVQHSVTASAFSNAALCQSCCLQSLRVHSLWHKILACTP
jgi:hypothetical protein